MPTNVPPLKLKDAFEGKFLIGNVLRYDVLQGKDPAGLAVATTHFNALTPENSMKLTVVQPREGRWDFAEADRFVEIAEECGATPVGHVLIWREQAPDWFFQDADGQPADRKLVLSRMRKHIAKVVGRYKGRIKMWDVVNEATSDNQDEYLWSPSTNPWLKALGEDYIAEAFRAAHKADPDAILIYNDYNIERNYKRPKALRLLKSLLDQGVPVHAVGIEGHGRMDEDEPDLGELEKAIEQFAALGLRVMITELDIGILQRHFKGAETAYEGTLTPEEEATLNPYKTGLPDEVARQHAERYRQIFEIFLRHQDVIDRVTIWGLQDGDSWLNDFTIKGRTDYPLLFDRQYRPKPAYFAIMEAASAKPRKRARAKKVRKAA